MAPTATCGDRSPSRGMWGLLRVYATPPADPQADLEPLGEERRPRTPLPRRGGGGRRGANRRARADMGHPRPGDRRRYGSTAPPAGAHVSWGEAGQRVAPRVDELHELVDLQQVEHAPDVRRAGDDREVPPRVATSAARRRASRARTSR